MFLPFFGKFVTIFWQFVCFLTYKFLKVKYSQKKAWNALFSYILKIESQTLVKESQEEGSWQAKYDKSQYFCAVNFPYFSGFPVFL